MTNKTAALLSYSRTTDTLPAAKSAGFFFRLMPRPAACALLIAGLATLMPVLTAQPAASQAPVGAIYVVKEGDTLWDISNRLTGNPFNYHSIAGRNRISNPDLIFPGQTLQTPPYSGSSP